MNVIRRDFDADVKIFINQSCISDTMQTSKMVLLVKITFH